MKNFITNIEGFIYDLTEGFGKMRLKAITEIALMVFLLGMLNLTFNVQPVVASVEVDWWPMFHHDLSHSGYSTSTAPNTNNTIWNYTTDDSVFSSPAVVDGKIYFGSDKVYCLDALTGAHIWNYTTGISGFSSPAVADGKVYVGSHDHKIYAFGAFVWSTNSVGNSKATFNLTDNIYTKGQGFTADTNITIYLIPDGADASPANAVADASTTTNSTGSLPITLVWSQPLTAGEYDIWADVNQNEVFDDGDVWNSQSIDIYGFDVIPELSIWTSTILILIIPTTIVTYKRKLLKTAIH